LVLILINNVADTLGLQNLNGNRVIPKNLDEQPDAVYMFMCGVFEPGNCLALLSVKTAALKP
jgi:hypothetical protein